MRKNEKSKKRSSDNIPFRCMCPNGVLQGDRWKGEYKVARRDLLRIGANTGLWVTDHGVLHVRMESRYKSYFLADHYADKSFIKQLS